MKVQNAWLSAKEGQSIRRVSRPLVILRKNNGLCDVRSVFGIDFTAEDWEVVRKDHIFILVDTELSGMAGCDSLTEVFRSEGRVKPNKFTRITFEWEEE